MKSSIDIYRVKCAGWYEPSEGRPTSKAFLTRELALTALVTHIVEEIDSPWHRTGGSTHVVTKFSADFEDLTDGAISGDTPAARIRNALACLGELAGSGLYASDASRKVIADLYVHLATATGGST